MADYDPDSVLTSPHPDRASMRVRPKLSRDALTKLVRKYNPDITDNAVQGEVDNIERESSGVSSNDTGDGGTSGGLYQHHNSRLTNLKDYATKHDKDWRDPEIQVQFSRLEKEKDYPKLLAFQQSNTDRSANEDAFKRIFERPASVLWQNNAEGKPVTDSPKFKFSDYAMKEFMDQPDTDIRYMDPAEYLQLTPPMEGKPFESPSGRSLKKSLDRGDQVEQIPSLDVSVDGPTAQVTDQDGRHRMLAAQEAGLQAVPVAVKGLKGSPTEIVGMDGVPQAFDHPRQPRQEAAEPQKEPISLLRQIGDAIIPRAEAAENPDWMKGAIPVQQTGNPDWMKGAVPAQVANQSVGNTPVTQMTEEEAQDAHLSPQQQREWIDAQNKEPAGAGLAAAASRGIAPYALGAGVGASAGAPFAGVGAIPGAAMGAGAVLLNQLASGVTGKPEIVQQATNKLMDLAGVRKPETMAERLTEQAAGGAASGFAGGEFAGLLGMVMKSPPSKVLANYLLNRGAGMQQTVARIAGEMAKGPMQQAIAGASSGAGSQLAAEAGLPPWMQTLVGMAAGLVPGARGAMPNMRHIDASPAAKKAIEAGFSIPPAEASEGHVGKFNVSNALAAEGGKVKLQQLASAQNQIVVNRKVASDLGLPPDTTMFPDAYEKVRAREGQVYREVQTAVPQVDLAADPIYRDAVKNVGADLKQLVEMFPHVKSNPELGSQIVTFEDDLLRNSTGDTPTVMKYIAELRREMTDNYRKPNNALAHRLADAQRSAASELENALERSVQDAPQYYRAKLGEAQKARDDQYRERAEQGLPLQGEMIERADAAVQNWSALLARANAKNQSNQTLLDRFREARRTMAKSYDAESVTNPSNGHVSGTGLGRLKKRGKPLSGALEEIADAANNFQKAFQNPSAFGGVEPLSVLDATFAASQAAKAVTHAAAHNWLGAVTHLGAGIAPLFRPLTRESILSPKNQNRMIQPRGSMGAAPLGGMTGAMLPTQPVPGNPGGNALMGLTTQQ